jgi:hypothetical protein
MTDLAPYAAGQRLAFRIDADALAGAFSVWLNGARLLENAAFAEPAENFHRIAFRTGAFRGIGGANPSDPATDRPLEPTTWIVASFTIA